MGSIIYAIGLVLMVSIVWLFSFGRKKSFFWSAVVDRYGTSQVENLKVFYAVATLTLSSVFGLICMSHYNAITTLTEFMDISAIAVLAIIYMTMVSDKSTAPIRCAWFMIPFFMDLILMLAMAPHGGVPSSHIIPEINVSSALQHIAPAPVRKYNVDDVLTISPSTSVFSSSTTTKMVLVGIEDPSGKCGTIEKELIGNNTVVSDTYLMPSSKPQVIYITKAFDNGNYQGDISVYHRSSNPFDDGSNSYKCYLKVSFNNENLKEIANNSQKITVSSVDHEDLLKIIASH